MNAVNVNKIQGIHGGKFAHTKPSGMTVHDLVWDYRNIHRMKWYICTQKMATWYMYAVL